MAARRHLTLRSHQATYLAQKPYDHSKKLDLLCSVSGARRIPTLEADEDRGTAMESVIERQH